MLTPDADVTAIADALLVALAAGLGAFAEFEQVEDAAQRIVRGLALRSRLDGLADRDMPKFPACQRSVAAAFPRRT